MGKTTINLYSTSIASVIHWIIAFSIVDCFESKMIGIAIATNIHFIFRFIIAVILTRTDEKVKEGIISFDSPESWKDLGVMCKLGFDSVLLKVMAWWAFDVFTQLASFLSVSELGGQTILRNIGLFTYMIPVGLSTSANALTGRYIGKDVVFLAKKIAS